jgi:hypothetical protein
MTNDIQKPDAAQAAFVLAEYHYRLAVEACHRVDPYGVSRALGMSQRFRRMGENFRKEG